MALPLALLGLHTRGNHASVENEDIPALMGHGCKSERADHGRSSTDAHAHRCCSAHRQHGQLDNSPSEKRPGHEKLLNAGTFSRENALQSQRKGTVGELGAYYRRLSEEIGMETWREGVRMREGPATENFDLTPLPWQFPQLKKRPLSSILELPSTTDALTSPLTSPLPRSLSREAYLNLPFTQRTEQEKRMRSQHFEVMKPHQREAVFTEQLMRLASGERDNAVEAERVEIALKRQRSPSCSEDRREAEERGQMQQHGNSWSEAQHGPAKRRCEEASRDGKGGRSGGEQDVCSWSMSMDVSSCSDPALCSLSSMRARRGEEAEVSRDGMEEGGGDCCSSRARAREDADVGQAPTVCRDASTLNMGREARGMEMGRTASGLSSPASLQVASSLLCFVLRVSSTCASSTYVGQVTTRLLQPPLPLRAERKGRRRAEESEENEESEESEERQGAQRRGVSSYCGKSTARLRARDSVARTYTCA